MKPLEAGAVVGRWTLTAKYLTPRGETYWDCVCSCGTRRGVRQASLSSGRTKSCGCLRSDRNIETKTTHGGTHEQLFRVWESMIARCHKPGSCGYKNYGGRGIYVCDRWRYSYASFRDDMGLRPSSNMSIDRVDNDGPYAPWNCRWATKLVQQNNTQNTRWITFRDRTQSLARWAAELCIPPSRIRDRLKKGTLSIEEVLLSPPNITKNNYRKVNHVTNP